MNSVRNIFSKKYIKKYEQKIKYLGPNNKIDLNSFLLSRLVIEIILVILCLLIPRFGLLVALIALILFHFIYTSVLIDNKLFARIDSLYDESIMFYNMLSLSLKDTKDLKISLEITCSKLGNSLTKEFKRILGNNKYNNDLKEVFTKVIETIPNTDVKNTLIDIKESDNYLKTIDESIKILQNKNVILIKDRYKYKPIYLIIVCMFFVVVISMLLLNVYTILDFFNNLFKI